MSESKPRVVHVNKSEFDLYIGRKFAGFEASKWANPYAIGKDGTREECVAKYEAYLRRTPELMAALPELKGKVLGCWCKNTNGEQDVACHGDVLIKVLEEEARRAIPDTETAVRLMEREIIQKTEDAATQILAERASALPVFSSHFSLGSSILTTEEAGKTSLGNPVSICDIAKEHSLKHVILVEDNIDGYLEAYKHIQKTGIAQLIYGLKMTICDDMTDKNEVTARNESKIIIFIKNTQGYHDIIRLWNRANTVGHFTPPRESGYGRLDWKTLKEYWTPNLSIALPYFSSFIAKNTLTMASIVPDLPIPIEQVTVFKELDSQLPFASLIDKAIKQYIESNNGLPQLQPVKSIYYKDESYFDIYVTFRAIHNRSEYMRPNVDHLYSNRFSFAAWKELTQ